MKRKTQNNRNALISKILVVSLFFSTVVFSQNSSVSPKPSSEEGMARAVMGIVPVFSGMYLSKQPATGILFSAMDLALIAGIWANREEAQRENSTSIYWGFLAATNVLDAIVSYKVWDEQRIPKTAFGWNPRQGLTAKAIWSF